ncbi:MAG: hypothetical protein ACPGVO_09440 [Spirulinaceae cyanobacterium]
MSLDYSEFEKLKARHPWLGVLWRIGDMGYYTGLLGAITAPMATVGMRLSADENDAVAALTWQQVFLIAFLYFVTCLIVLISSAKLKELAFYLGGGIEQYYDD